MLFGGLNHLKQEALQDKKRLAHSCPCNFPLDVLLFSCDQSVDQQHPALASSELWLEGAKSLVAIFETCHLLCLLMSKPVTTLNIPEAHPKHATPTRASASRSDA